LIEAGPEILSVQVRYHGDTVEVNTRGRGALRIAKGTASKVLLNDAPAPVAAKEDLWLMEVGSPGAIAINGIAFATDPAARCKGIGVPIGYGGNYKGPEQSALVRFKTSASTDMILEWRGTHEKAWKRVLNPDPVTAHYYLLTDLEHGKAYQLRLTCRAADGRVGALEAEYTYVDSALAK
jgi:hypothetical protein